MRMNSNMAHYFFAAAKADSPQGGIYSIDTQTLQVRSFIQMDSVSYLAFPQCGREDLLYAVGQEASSENYLAIFRIGVNGELALQDQRKTNGKSSCHLCTSPDGEWIYCANYSSGTLCEYKLKDGLFCEEKIRQELHCTGKLGPHAKRQTKPHPHCTIFTPDGKYLCVPDLGLDEILIYAYSRENGISSEPVSRYRSFNPGAGPRHLIFAPSGRKAYLANEVDSSVSVLEYCNGTFTHCSSCSTLPEPDEKNTVAAIRITPDRKFLCLSNRGDETAAYFRIGEDELLSERRFVHVQGKNPRDIYFLPGGIFGSCNEFSNDITFFQYNGEGQGTFTFMPEKTLHVPNPLCILCK